MKSNKAITTEVPFPLKAKNVTGFDLLRNQIRQMRGKIKLWENAMFILVEVPLVPKEVNKILPRLMFLKKHSPAILFIADYPKTAFTIPYREAALLIPVCTPLGSGIHCPWMLVDDDTALIYGRELLGYPKKLAELQFKRTGKKLAESVKRRGVKIAQVTGTILEKEEKPAPVLGYKTFNIGGMGQRFVINPISFFKPKEIIHESYSAKMSLSLQFSDYDPIKKLIANFKNPLKARFARIDILGSKILMPVGLTGTRVFRNTFNMRFR